MKNIMTAAALAAMLALSACAAGPQSTNCCASMNCCSGMSCCCSKMKCCNNMKNCCCMKGGMQGCPYNPKK